ncbi:RNA-binding protein [Grosmannia clavigera kw1407]|uniref:RNA-binding protein n=1 Tax=Grosmannia clavigera (strain kw1407 / UAMH 11150) TaxID=655863 RepID=F0XTR6_GROCL|nr:RNA-binding protein [Grosmannia clavigera kw1407]EFW98928.1 RNA-binding protein [Grosmannia clavigera kw1407]
MSSAVAELEAGLQAMQGLKPPGVSGSRITALTSLCVANVQSESVLIQKLYTHFKRTPGTHKLGVLYVVDSVTRKWLDQAKLQGQAVNSSAPDGTYAAGVNRVTELIPVLMNDILSSAPADQKEKIRKLVDIWEKGQTFPPKLIESFKDRLNAAQPNSSTTPPGSPPSNVLAPSAAPRPDAAAGPPAIPPNIMETLASIARQSSSAGNAGPTPGLTATPPNMSAPFGNGPNNANMPQHMANQMPAGMSYPPQSMPFQMPSALSGAAAPTPQISMPFPTPAATNQMLPSGFPGLAAGLNTAALQQQQPQQPAGGNMQQNLFFIQALLAQGLSLDQISGILAQVNGDGPAAPAAPTSLVPAALAAAVAAAGGAGGAGGMPPGWPQNSSAGGYAGAGAPDWSSSANVLDRFGRQSPNRGRGRSRSRSPGRYYDERGSPRGRDERRSSPGRGDKEHRERGRGREYRQRSPAGGRRGGSGNDGVSPHREPPAPTEKWIEHDASLPPGSIRVLSRTLFVGGVTISEQELRAIFGRFGAVQTCIVNKEKRHAFVKMYTRKDAELARSGMELMRSDDSGLRTRWGVGFGPRDCSDYSKGISVIPIPKLTEADRKWLLTAPWGGSGGRQIEPGMVVEEPDIEIGAGVSSKAISRRMQTDRGGVNGPRSTRREEELAAATKGSHEGGSGGGGGRGTRRGGRGSGRGDDHGGNGGNNGSNQHNVVGGSQEAPNMGAFPFGLTMGPNGMPVFPSGFQFPAPSQSGSL